MKKYCQQCGKIFESEDKDLNFCKDCLAENHLWDEWLDSIERKNNTTSNKNIKELKND